MDDNQETPVVEPVVEGGEEEVKPAEEGVMPTEPVVEGETPASDEMPAAPAEEAPAA